MKKYTFQERLCQDFLISSIKVCSAGRCAIHNAVFAGRQGYRPLELSERAKSAKDGFYHVQDKAPC